MKTFSVTSDHTSHLNLSLRYGKHLLHVVKFLESMTMGYTCLLYVVKYFQFLTTAYTSLLHVVIDIYNSRVRDKWPVAHTHRKLCYLAMVKF